MSKKNKKSTMTITQALNELKLLDKRIVKTITKSKIGVTIGTKIQNNFDETAAKADLQSVTDMIERRAAIKMLINKSNISTKVKVAGRQMSVLEAIEYKATIEYKNVLLRQVTSQYNAAVQEVNYNNEEVKRRLDSQISSVFEKPTDKDVKDFTATFEKNNNYSLSNPIKIEELSKTLDEEIDVFTNEVDYVLSTSNATTTIEI